MHHNFTYWPILWLGPCTLISDGIRKKVREVHLYVNLHIFVFCYILQFNDKTNYDKVLSYQILTDNNYTFPLAPWSDDARCQTQAWKVPITIDVHGIPPYAFHIKSLSVLLDPYCDIETCTMDKKNRDLYCRRDCIECQFHPKHRFPLIPTSHWLRNSHTYILCYHEN